MLQYESEYSIFMTHRGLNGNHYNIISYELRRQTVQGYFHSNQQKLNSLCIWSNG